MNDATKTALAHNLITENDLAEVYEQGKSRTAWHDHHFFHLLEVLDSGEMIYQSRPLADDWMFEDVD